MSGIADFIVPARAHAWKCRGRFVVAGWLFLLLPSSVPADGADLFVDRALASGIDFVHFNGMSGELYFMENVGSGIGLLDYDADGDLDVYLVQGHMLGEGKTLADALLPPPPGYPSHDRLYRNDLMVTVDGVRQPRFTDVTEAAGIHAPGYGMGVTAGDYDGDGHVDLYVTNQGANQLLRNDGERSFTDVTATSAVAGDKWSVSATFLDYDRDGDLDLFVGNYVHYDTNRNKECFAPTGGRDYCSPTFFTAATDTLYRNRGDGSFEDVSSAAGIETAYGPALGVVAADFDGDGWTDVYVANDAAANQLWINQRNGTFRDDALLAGVAVNMEGAAEASMGVDAGDFDGDGDEDLFMTHLIGETNTLYVNDGGGWFEDRSLASGLAAPSKTYTAFGTRWFDYDNDGWLDLFVANGDVRLVPTLARAGDAYPLHQPNQLFHNLRNGRFEEVTHRAGPVFRLSEVSRGAAFGDLDNDGDTDILVSNNSGPVRLLLNQVGAESHWLGIGLKDALGHEVTGPRIAVHRAGTAVLWRRTRRDGSYASANDPRVIFGLGENPSVPAVKVHWLDGTVEEWAPVQTDRYLTLEKGQGRQMEESR